MCVQLGCFLAILKGAQPDKYVFVFNSAIGGVLDWAICSAILIVQSPQKYAWP